MQSIAVVIIIVYFLVYTFTIILQRCLVIFNLYQVYLFLKQDGSGYRLWCVRDELERGYAVDATRRTLVQFDPSVVIERMKARFSSEGWDAKVVTLSSL